MPMSKRAAAEFFGTFWLVFGGCGSAVIAAGFPAVGIGFAGVALAFGLTVLTMCYAVGHISGGHLNPAVTLGLVVGKRFPAKDLPAYVIAQVLGAIAAAACSTTLRSEPPVSTRMRASPPMVTARIRPVDTPCSPDWSPRLC